MKSKLGLALLAGSALLSAAATTQTAAPGVVAMTPSGMKWVSQGGLALPGLEQVNLVSGIRSCPDPTPCDSDSRKVSRSRRTLTRILERSRSCREHSQLATAKSLMPPT